MAKIGVIDYGSGNFTSVWNAISSLTEDVKVIRTAAEFDDCSHIVLPGVGAFHAAMTKVKNMNIIEALSEEVLVKKKQFLGICVGMQMLATSGTEFGASDGLGFVPGRVVKFDIDSTLFSLPHIGWNNLSNMDHSPLFDGMDDNATFYFVHSFHLQPEGNLKTVNSDYGGEFVASLSVDNIHGVQFHPEKSQFYGLKLLRNFISLS
ncbi:MAG: imidazole glycerol phosphate synthase subunit HisH [Bacteroidota bacterium]